MVFNMCNTIGRIYARFMWNAISNVEKLYHTLKNKIDIPKVEELLLQ